MTDIEYMIGELKKRFANLDFEADSKIRQREAFKQSIFDLNDDLHHLEKDMLALEAVIKMLEAKWITTIMTAIMMD